MQIETKEVREGLHDGKTVWICHYNQPSLDKKPLRHVKPTRCLVCPNEELPKNKRVYYSKSHFRPLNVIGNKLSNVLSPVDNTGYRSSIGNELFVFDNEQECVECYNSQVSAVIQMVVDRMKHVLSDLEDKRNYLTSLIQIDKT